MAVAENPKLRAAYDAAVKKAGGNQKDPKVIAARAALGADRASKGLAVNSGGVGVAGAAPGSVNGSAPPPSDVTTPRDAPNPGGPGTFPNPVGGAQGNPDPGYSGYSAPAGAVIGGSGPLDTSPLAPGKAPGSFSDVVNSGVNTALDSTELGNYANNANYSNAFGQQTSSIGPDGKPVVTNRLSQGNQTAVNGIQGSGANAENVLGGFLGSDGTAQGDAGNPLAGLQSATYNRLTGAGSVNGIDQTFQRNQEQLAQTLANKAIPVGSKAYEQQMQSLQQDYNLQKQNASDSSVSQVFGQLPNLSQIGQAGYMDPSKGQIAPFNTTQFQTPNTGDIYGTYQGGQNVAGTNQTNKTVAAGHDQAGIQVANITGKAAIAKAIIDGQQSGSGTFAP